jgi:hypothetical protein
VATIRTRKRADGSCGYTAQIRIHDAKAIVHQEAKTFSRRAAAEKWAKAREVELETPIVKQLTLDPLATDAIPFVSLYVHLSFRSMYRKCAATAPALWPPPDTLIMTSGVPRTVRPMQSRSADEKVGRVPGARRP